MGSLSSRQIEKEIFSQRTFAIRPWRIMNSPAHTVTTFLSKWILSEPREYTTGLFLFPRPPALTYLSKNFKHMKRNTIAGFNVTCVGMSAIIHIFLHGLGDTLADKAALECLAV